MKQYVGFVRDHSASMRSIAKGAAKDYNSNLLAIQNAARETGLDTILNVVKCGVGWDAKVVREVVNSNVYVVEPLNENNYETSGNGTPLWDSVGEIITLMEHVPDKNDPEVTFLVMVITDGENNRQIKWTADTLMFKIKQLQATDRWTFVFRVPRGYKTTLVRLGIPDGNILEWDQTDSGIAKSTDITASAVSSYYTNRITRGTTSTNKFYADIGNIHQNIVSDALTDISYKIEAVRVPGLDDGIAIKEFVEQSTHQGRYVTGEWYYELTKTEKVQESKKIIIYDSSSYRYFIGDASARHLLGLPTYGEIKLVPGNLGKYKVFIQSTSLNRKLVGGTYLIRQK